MKKIIYGLICSCLVYCLSAAGVSLGTSARINDIHVETQALRCEVAHLRDQLNTLIRRSPCSFVKHTCHRPIFSPSGHSSCPSALYSPCGESGHLHNSDGIEAGFAENTREFDDYARMWGSPRNLLLLACIGSTVTTSPFLGLRSAFDASDLIVNLPTMNEDLRFLKEHVEIEKKLNCYGICLPDRPIIELGGKIEGIAFTQKDWNRGLATSDLDLGCARLDVLVQASKAVHGFMALNMDTNAFSLLNNSDLAIQLQGGASRVFNSRVFVSRAFVTIGDLNCLPVYLTIGQMFVPFGRYASNMVTRTLTVQLARTNQRALLLGFYQNGLYASLYGFRGETLVSAAPNVNQGGVNIGYEKRWDSGSLNIGAGYITNIADSVGFQITGNSRGFCGFGLCSAAEVLRHSVPAYDVHGEFSLDKLNIFAEYIAVEGRFDYWDLNFNGRGAQPSASNVELAYNFKLADCPASIAVGYGTTAQALALGLPKSSFTTAFNVSIWKNTIESLEFRHDDNYDCPDFVGCTKTVPMACYATGGGRNTYMAQVGVYF